MIARRPANARIIFPLVSPSARCAVICVVFTDEKVESARSASEIVACAEPEPTTDIVSIDCTCEFAGTDTSFELVVVMAFESVLLKTFTVTAKGRWFSTLTGSEVVSLITLTF